MKLAILLAALMSPLSILAEEVQQPSSQSQNACAFTEGSLLYCSEMQPLVTPVEAKSEVVRYLVMQPKMIWGDFVPLMAGAEAAHGFCVNLFSEFFTTAVFAKLNISGRMHASKDEKVEAVSLSEEGKFFSISKGLHPAESIICEATKN